VTQTTGSPDPTDEAKSRQSDEGAHGCDDGQDAKKVNPSATPGKRSREASAHQAAVQAGRCTKVPFGVHSKQKGGQGRAMPVETAPWTSLRAHEALRD
jgi:hypothetical protein